MTALGYQPHGQVSTSDTAALPLDSEAVRRFLRTVYSGPELDALTGSTDRVLIDDAVRQAIAAVNNSWRAGLGLTPHAPGTPGAADPVLLARALSHQEDSWFEETPAGLCWFVHHLDLEQVSPAFLSRWARTGEPRLIFNYRDPRDTLVSMVNFLSGRPPGRVGEFADHQVYTGILRAVSTMPERLGLALADPCFPGANAFERALWLLHHPAVCKVSFEELVGPRGGGTAADQAAAVERIAHFVGAEVDGQHLAGRLFNPDSFTFHEGRIGAWRDHFTSELETLFEQKYGRLLDLYSYR